MYDSQLSNLIQSSLARLNLELTAAAPATAAEVSRWTAYLSGTARAEDYFKHPLAYPSLLLPWWFEKTLRDQPDLSFQSDLVFSTINGYYYIRLIDNLMDGNATVELRMLPVLAFFHTQFQTAYHNYFEPKHPFWSTFFSAWFHSAEVTLVDASLSEIDLNQFEQITAQKTCAAKIPLAAVSYRQNRPDLIEPWSRFVDLFGCWHQLRNDLFDWQRDEARNTRTYFLGEAQRQQPDEPTTVWVVREGFAWAMEQLQSWMVDLKALAAQLASPDLTSYLDIREKMLEERARAAEDGFRHLAKILVADR